MAARIMAFAGSTRGESFNRRLVRIAAQGAEAAGATVTVVDLADYPMPLFDQDLEKRDGLPEKAREFKALLLDHAGLLIASPEYNSSVSGVLKNSIDWASRAEEEGEKPLACFQGRVAGIMSASPGGLGGLRGLVHLRSILGNLGVLVVPEQVAVAGAHQAFDEEGRLRDERKAAAAAQIGARVTQVAAALA